MSCRNIRFFALLLAGIILCGCSGGTYHAEKLFWKAEQRFKQTLGQDKKPSPKELEDLIYAFQEITIRFPVWEKDSQVRMSLASLYLMQGSIDKAEAQYRKVCESYADQPLQCSSALKNLGLIFENQNEWEKAEECYIKIIENFPLTPNGMITCIYLAQKYQDRGEADKAKGAYLAALSLYRKVLENVPDNPQALHAVNMSVPCVIYLEGEQGALVYLKEIQGNFKGTLAAHQALLSAGRVYQYNLKQPENAAELYKLLLKTKTIESLRQQAEEELKKIETVSDDRK